MINLKQIITTLLFALIGFTSFAQPTVCLKCMEDVWSEDGTKRLYRNYRVLPAYDNGYQPVMRLDVYGKPTNIYSSYFVNDRTDGFPRWEYRDIFEDANGNEVLIDTVFIESGAALLVGRITPVSDKVFESFSHDRKLVIVVKQGGKILFERASLKLTIDSKIIFDFKKSNNKGNERDNRLMLGYSWFSKTWPPEGGGENPYGDKYNGRGNNSGKQCLVSEITQVVDNSFIQLGEKTMDSNSKDHYQWPLCGLDKQLEVIERKPVKETKPGKLYSIRNNTLYLNHKINSINVYDWSGNIVSQFENQSEINLEGLNGLVISGTINNQAFSDRIPVVK